MTAHPNVEPRMNLPSVNAWSVTRPFTGGITMKSALILSTMASDDEMMVSGFTGSNSSLTDLSMTLVDSFAPS